MRNVFVSYVTSSFSRGTPMHAVTYYLCIVQAASILQVFKEIYVCISQLCHPCHVPTHFVFLDWIILLIIKVCEQHKLWNFSLQNFLHSIIVYQTKWQSAKKYKKLDIFKFFKKELKSLLESHSFFSVDEFLQFWVKMVCKVFLPLSSD
jgi:hypothetical protein